MDTPKKDEQENMPLSPEDIKAIGEIELGPAKHEVFLNNHYKKLIWGIIGLAVVGAGAIALYSHNEDARAQASSLSVAAIKADKPFAMAQPGEYDAKSIEAIAAQYADTPAANTAELLEALNLLNSSKPESGISLLKELSQGSNILIASRAGTAVASYYMEAAQNEQAVAQWKQVSQMEDNPYTQLAFLCLGDLAQNAGEKEAARSYYQQGISRNKQSALASDLQNRLLLIDVDTPTAAPISLAAPATEESNDQLELPEAPAVDTESTLPAIDMMPNMDTGTSSPLILDGQPSADSPI